MTVNLLTEHHLKFLSLKGGCRGSSESTLVKMSNCWKSNAVAHINSLLSLCSDCNFADSVCVSSSLCGRLVWCM